MKAWAALHFAGTESGKGSFVLANRAEWKETALPDTDTEAYQLGIYEQTQICDNAYVTIATQKFL